MLAMTAFAANSILCRLALKTTTIDPTSFTAIRLLAGAVTLLFISLGLNRRSTVIAGDWISAAALFTYAIAFSWAYVAWTTGSGALLLFGAVQGTMIFAGLARGERLTWRQTIGLATAIVGATYLVWPSTATPPWRAALSMILAGVAWGVYSLRGRGATNPIAVTAGNFLRSVPFAGIASLAMWPHAVRDPLGATYAVASGALASGVGYAIWYTALRGHTAITAATVQLSVPVLTALGGILLLGEPLTAPLVIAGTAILGGIALVIWKPAEPTRRRA